MLLLIDNKWSLLQQQQQQQQQLKRKKFLKRGCK
jgi:hypothetical protein